MFFRLEATQNLIFNYEAYWVTLYQLHQLKIYVLSKQSSGLLYNRSITLSSKLKKKYLKNEMLL